MINTTPDGYSRMLAAVTGTIRAVHLFVHSGELSGYGYTEERIDPEKWEDGRYPDVVWELEASEQPARVLGYYVTGEDGGILFSENFPPSSENDDDEPGYVIGRKGDRIAVGLRLNMSFLSSR